MERMGSGSRHGGGLVIRYRRQKPMTITSAFGGFRAFGLSIPGFGLDNTQTLVTARFTTSKFFWWDARPFWNYK